jgi:hypothetical protein
VPRHPYHSMLAHSTLRRHLSQIGDFSSLSVGVVDQGLVASAGSCPADCQSTHKDWVGVGCDGVIAVGPISSHCSDRLYFHCCDNLSNEVIANEIGEFLDNLNELRSDEFSLVRIVGVLISLLAAILRN